MIKRIIYVKALIIITMFSLLLTQCKGGVGGDENGLFGDFAIIAIDLGSVGMPSGIYSIKVRVTAADFGLIEKDFKPNTIITMNVPAGNFRHFEVLAFIDPNDPGVALIYRGTALVNLATGAVALPISMSLYETKIVIPDPYIPNYRLVQINDISGAGWKVKLGSDFTTPISNLYPVDVDIDSQGRIYIVHSSTSSPKVIRIENMNSTSYTTIDSGTGSDFVVALAIDRINKWVYYATNSTSSYLFRCDYNGNNQKSYNLNPISNIRGFAVDNEGILYIAHGVNSITKYNPNIGNGQIIKTYTPADIPQLNNPYHILVKPPYIYVDNYGGANGYKILQLNYSNLTFIKGYGVQASGADTSPGMFYGPKHFVAILNRKITIIDDSGYDKLISMDDIDGTNWDTFGATGGGVGQFRFYSNC